MDERERTAALEAAIRDAVAGQATRAQPRPPAGLPPERVRIQWLLLMLGWACIAYIWIARPAVLFGGGDEVATPTAAVREADLRYAIYLTHHEVQRFHADSGRLPATLADLELGPDPAVRLEASPDGRWAVVGTDGSLSLRLADTENTDSFLGGSLRVLQAAQ